MIELDPYAAHVIGTVFQSNEVSDAAVNVDHLDWNGQPVGMGADWQTTQAISLESPRQQAEQPDWLASADVDTEPPMPFDQTRAKPVPTFNSSPQPPAESSEDIPDFLRAAGWSASTGEFDESKPVFESEDASGAAQPLEQGDLPDWIKAMAPVEASQTEQPPAEPTQDEDLPDWIKNILARARWALLPQQMTHLIG